MGSFLGKIIDSSASPVLSHSGRRVSGAVFDESESHNTLFKKRSFLIKELMRLFESNDVDYIDIESMNLPTIYLDKNNYEYKLIGFSYDGEVHLELSRGKISDEILLKDIDFNHDLVEFYDWFINNINTIRKNVAGSVNQPSHGKVSDSNSSTRGRLATYATLAEALHSNGIDYSLDDYRIWSANIPLDDHGRNSNTFIQVYGDGFEGYASEDEAMDALRIFYDDNGRDVFYDSINITSLCIRVHDGANKPLLEWYVDSTSLRSSFVVGVIDAIGFCSEEHMSVAEFFDYMSKFVNLDTNYFIGEEEFEQKYLVYDSKTVSGDAKIAGKRTPRSVSDSDDLSGWVERDGGHMWEAIYRKDYDDAPPMRIFVREESAGHNVYYVDTYLLSALMFEDVADILRLNAFDSFSKAADVADRIAAAYSRFHKSLFDVLKG